jgi:hypothetical protein
MSTDLTQNQDQGDLLIPAELMIKGKYADDSVFANMSGSGFLPRLQLNNAMSKLVQRGKAKIGGYILVQGKENIIADYGEELSCLVLAWRPKALLFKSDNSGTAYFNPRTQGFQNVEKLADQKPRPKGALYGPEYLIYLPDQRTAASFHLNNPTMRNRAAEMKALIGRAATLRSEEIDSKGNLWYGPVITGCSTPLPLPESGTPERESLTAYIKAEIQKFSNPPDEEVEAAEEVTDGQQAQAGSSERPR